MATHSIRLPSSTAPMKCGTTQAMPALRGFKHCSKPAARRNRCRNQHVPSNPAVTAQRSLSGGFPRDQSHLCSNRDTECDDPDGHVRGTVWVPGKDKLYRCLCPRKRRYEQPQPRGSPRHRFGCRTGILHGRAKLSPLPSCDEVRSETLARMAAASLRVVDACI